MADYMKPLVLVYQELRNVSTTLPNPTLPGVLVGPGYQVLTYALDKSLIYSGTYDSGAGNTVAMPSPVPGMKLIEAGLVVYLDDCFAVLADNAGDADGVVTAASADLNKVVSASSLFVTNKVAQGDYITIGNGVTSLSTRVLSVTNETTLRTAKNIGFVAADATFTITRKLNDVVLGSAFIANDLDNNQVELAPGATTLVEGVARTVSAAKIYVAYRALRTDICVQPLDITSTTDIETKLGRIVPENPLAFGANLMFSASATPIQALGVESTDLVGFSKARDTLSTRDVYAIGLLTDDAAIIAAFKSHCDAMSVPEKNKFRVCIGGSVLTLVKNMAGSATGAAVKDPNNNIILFDDYSAEFLSDGVGPGDDLHVGAEVYVIDEVVNENRLKVMADKDFPAVATGLTYTITRTLSKTQQAEEIAATSKSLKSKRCIMTFPNVVVFDNVELPGYYLNAILAGMICGLPSQAGLTNKGVSGIDAIKNSNFYFTDEQLDIIAAGGTCVFVQQTETALPYIRHQLTTDMDLLETKEISVVKNNDYLSIFFRDIVKKFLGEWNVTFELLGIMRQALSAGIDFQKMARLPKIGSPLISATIETLEISPLSADRVEIYVVTQQPRPLNNIGLHMIL